MVSTNVEMTHMREGGVENKMFFDGLLIRFPQRIISSVCLTCVAVPKVYLNVIKRRVSECDGMFCEV